MSYLAFALKYRPKNFDEVIGQEHIVEPLKNAVINNRVHHAYLFSGPRGVGKTSLARILAKSLNCGQGPTVNPCGKCLSCVESAQGKSLDIIEIDGASNNGVEEIRVLRENVKLSTAHSRYKIYIIDEVHMLSNSAFNALLKTLEEPPPHVKFIFATTHPNKLLPTILSRCQKFQFNLVSLPEIVNKLKKIIDIEDIEIEETLLYTIGRASGGSIRDAESLLDQLVPVILEKKSVKDIFSFLGIIDEESLNTMLKALITKDFEFCLDFVDKIIKEGKDLGVFVDAFIEHLRNLLLSKVTIKTFKELSEVSPQSKEFILSLSQQVSTREVLKIIDLLIEAKELSYHLSTIKIPLELALIKFAYTGNLDDGPAIKEKRTNKPEIVKEVSVAPEGKKISDLDLELEDIDFESKEEDKIENEMKNKINNEDNESLEGDDFLSKALAAKWDDIIKHMQKVRAAIASHLSFCQPVSSKGYVVTLGFNKEDHFHKESLENSKNVIFIEDILSKFMDQSIAVKFILKDSIDNKPQSKLKVSEKPLPEVKIKDTKINYNTKTDKGLEISKNDMPELKDKTGNAGDDEGFINDLLDAFGGKFHNDD